MLPPSAPAEKISLHHCRIVCPGGRIADKNATQRCSGTELPVPRRGAVKSLPLCNAVPDRPFLQTTFENMEKQISAPKTNATTRSSTHSMLNGVCTFGGGITALSGEPRPPPLCCSRSSSRRARSGSKFPLVISQDKTRHLARDGNQPAPGVPDCQTVPSTHGQGGGQASQCRCRWSALADADQE